ncbi:hypothetical protein K8S19_11310 [bacterium]|nr:hypothetical protein [bacterium]
MKFPTSMPVLLLMGFCFFTLHAPVVAGTFGKNKLQTRQFQWQVFETEHFEIHYYPEEEVLAREVCEIAEDAYRFDTHLLREKPLLKTPLFLYRNQIDFQQTNILPHIIGVGTGGFTEAYKNRIALPAPDSPKSLREVVYHEFIHALQFNILYGEGMRSFRVYKGYLIPMWIIEGLAEYAAQSWDSYADMIIRDAVHYERLVPLTLMEGFNHLEDVYLAYKQSQLAMHYIAERFGEDKLSLIFKKFKNQIALSQILRETLGMGLQDFNREFMFWARQKYWLQTEGREKPGNFSSPVDHAPPGRIILTTGAAWSPDGHTLAYCSNREQWFRIYLKPRGSAGKGVAFTHIKFESFNIRGRPIAWSPDSRQIAFVAQIEGKKHLYLLDVKTRKLIKKNIPVDDLFSPAWSPDGGTIALSGVKNGVSDIFIYNLSSGTLRSVTQDRFADRSPVWTPDGNALVYVSERNNFLQLYIKTLKEPGHESVALTWDAAQHTAPCFSSDGSWIYFSSDQSGIFNLCRMNLVTFQMFQITNIRSGAFQPAISPDGKKIVFTVYQNGNHALYVMPASYLQKEREVIVVPAATRVDSPADPNAASPKDTPETSPEANMGETVVLEKKAGVIQKQHPYHFRFSPDLLFLLAGYDSSQGVVGGGYFTASDYLGDHLVNLYSDFVPGYQANTQLTYSNLAYPIDIQLGIKYSRYYYRILDLETSDLLDEFNDEAIGGAISFQKPFSMYDRIEMEVGLSYLKREHEDFTQNRRVGTLRLSLVHDSTAWYEYAPADGFRHRLSLLTADKILGGEERYQILQLNSQLYKTLDFISPTLVFGSRLMLAGSFGSDRPVYLSGGIGLLPDSATIRGYRYGELLGSLSSVSLWRGISTILFGRSIFY